MHAASLMHYILSYVSEVKVCNYVSYLYTYIIATHATILLEQYTTTSQLLFDCSIRAYQSKHVSCRHEKLKISV